MKRFIFILFIFIPNLLLIAQSVEQRQFQLAQSYEKSGKLEDASRLYFELLQKAPDNNEYLLAWFRVTKQINRYTEILEYLQSRIETRNDFVTNLLIAEAYWLKGRPIDANSAWKSAQNFARTEEDFAKIASSMITVRQFQKAIDVYLEARKQFKQTTLFSNELIKLYSAVGNFVEATDEILKDFQVSRNLQVAQGRIYALIINEDAKQYLIDRLEKEYLKASSALFPFLYVWFNRTLGQYQKAFEITINIDKLQNANFTEILRFANQSRIDGELEISLKAYSYIIENAEKNNPIIPSVLYGYANTLEQQLIRSKNPEKKQLERVKEVYLKIVKDYPNSSQQFDGFYRLAQIYLEIDNDPRKGIEYLNQINEKFGFTDLYFLAKFDLSKMYLYLEDFEKSKSINLEIINKIPKNSRNNFADQINSAYFNIAKIHYYQGQIDSTIFYLDKIQITSTSPITNDYLAFYSFITTNQNLNAAIRSYAKGEFYEFIKDYPKSLENYEKASKFGIGSELEELAILNIAEINMRMNNLDKSIQIYNEYLDKFPNSVYLDNVYMKIAEIYQVQGKSDLAESTFTKILINFPKSIYYEEARKQIREIRSRRVP